MRVWNYIVGLLGVKSHWARTREELAAAEQRAVAEGRPDAADHIRIISDLRDKVAFDTEEKARP